MFGVRVGRLKNVLKDEFEPAEYEKSIFSLSSEGALTVDPNDWVIAQP